MSLAQDEKVPAELSAHGLGGDRADSEDRVPYGETAQDEDGNQEQMLLSDDENSSIGMVGSVASIPPNASPLSITGPEEAREPYKAVEVLLLTFEYTELDLGRETATVRAAFRRLGYKVMRYNIKMRRSLERLQTVLKKFLRQAKDDTLLIVYYHGHGELGADKGLGLFSHNYSGSNRRLWDSFLDLARNNAYLYDVDGYFRDRNPRWQPIARISWESIRAPIMEAKADTLVILDCCNAGLAATVPPTAGAAQDNGDGAEVDDGKDDISDDVYDSVKEWEGLSEAQSEEGSEQAEEEREQAGEEREQAGEEGEQAEEEREQAEEEEERDQREAASTPVTNTNDNHTVRANRLEERKELIGACGWGTATMNHMSPALCEVLEKRLRSPNSNMSTFRLVREMNNVLVEKFFGTDAIDWDIPQAVHYVLRQEEDGTGTGLRAGKIVLPFFYTP